MGRPRLHTDEQRREIRRIKSAKWRAANPERAREINRESMRRAAAAKAIAEGREPGKIGRPPEKTEAEKRAVRLEKSKRYYTRNSKKVSAKAAARQKEKRIAQKMGSFQYKPVGWNKLTDEQRRERERVNFHKRRARIKQVGGTFTAADIEHLMKRQKGKCAFCLQSFGDEKPHIDHYMPLALGGSNDRTNLRLLHPACNLMKGAHHPIEFAQANGLLCF